MSADQQDPPEPPQAPDTVQVMDTGAQPFLTRAARRAARQAQPDVELPPIAHVTRVIGIPMTVVGALLIAVSAFAGEIVLALAVLLGSLVISWGWPRAAGLPSPKGSSAVLALTSALLVWSYVVAETSPYLRWSSAALALGAIAMFVQQLLRRDGRPRLAESVMGTAFGLVVIASGLAYLPLVHVPDGPQLIACAVAAIAAGTGADLFVRNPAVRPWLLPLSMVMGGLASTLLSVALGAPDIPPAALVGVCCAALGHAFRRLLAPEAGSFSSQGQIATGLSSVAIPGPLLWALYELVVR